MLHIIKNVFWVSVLFVVTGPYLALAQTNPCAGLTAWECGRDINAYSTGLPEGSVIGIISATLSWLLAILGFIAIAGFVIAGLMYLTAAGDEGQAEKAKNAMKYSIIGVIVALMGYVVILAVDSWLTASTYF
ncbi:MAG: hypothetical protein E6P95_00995 [Candidatus Moraniibacteriota bacterium]|nr:MAG: hypothetical protein E6P95_00995 [Candidatus Moranbacteria bacterium]